VVFSDHCIDLPVSNPALLIDYCRPLINTYGIFDLTPIVFFVAPGSVLFPLTSQKLIEITTALLVFPDMLGNGLTLRAMLGVI